MCHLHKMIYKNVLYNKTQHITILGMHIGFDFKEVVNWLWIVLIKA